MSLMTRDSFFDLDRMFDGFFAPANTNTQSALKAFTPRVDIKEDEKAYSIIADLPGVNKDDLHVTLDKGIMSIQASTSDEHTEKDGEKVIRQERYSGNFYRSFNLGENVQDADIEAKFKDGVLTLVVPKTKEKQPETKKITIL